MILNKYTSMSLSKSILIVESCVIAAGLIALGNWMLPLYAIVCVFVATKIIDYIIDGGSNDKLLFIISDKHEQLREYIVKDLDRGGTYITSNGIYTSERKDMIFIVVPRHELVFVQSYIKDVDPEVFMVIVNAHETLGYGFKSIGNK